MLYRKRAVQNPGVTQATSVDWWGTETLLKAVQRNSCLDDERRVQRKDVLRGSNTGWMALGRQWVSGDSVSDAWLSQQ